MNKLANLEQVMQKLRGYLPQYLTEHGLDVAKNFTCLNPKHEDKSPSMSCKGNPENAYCFSCSVTMDIFQACHWLEAKPVSGPGFIEENVMYLAKKFGIEVEVEEMTEEELYRHRTYQAYRDAASLIADRNFGEYKTLNKEIKRRGWKPDTTKVGTVVYKDFRNTLKSMGYEPKFLEEIDLARADIFNETNMIFTICDEHGRPVGFAARCLEDNGGPKYMNQRTTGLRCNIYQKGKRLYELHTALKHTPPLYIFEGYADVITAQNAGFFNCVAIGGTAFNQQHIDSLKSLGQNDIVLSLDGDNAGRSRTIELLDKFFSGNRDMRVSIINLPDGKDPDDLIREDGLEAFTSLKKFTAFEWRLNLYNDEVPPEEICHTMIPLIVNESSFLIQDKLCKELAKFTGVDVKTISNELQRLQNKREYQKQQEKEIIFSQTFENIKRSPEDAKVLLHEAVSKIEEIEEKYDENSFSVDSVLDFISQQRNIEETATGEFAGFHLSELGLKGLGDKLNGNWREDVFMCFGGRANVGKSALMCQMAYEIASSPTNNACVIYHTIDDSKEQILPRFVCQAYGNIDLTINQVRNPNYYKIHDEQGDALLQRRSLGYNELTRLIRNGNLIIKDVREGSSFAFGESLIHYYKRKYPDRRIVYILDNLHKTPDFATLEPRMRFKSLSNHMKETAAKHHICIMATVEYTKLPPGTIPTNDNIAETRAIEYDANFLGHLYNDLHERDVEAVCFHEHQGEILPRIRLGVGKNKITDFKGRIFLDFYPSSGMFKYVSIDMAEAEMKAQMQAKQNNKDSFKSTSSKKYQSKNSDGDQNT